MTNNRIESDTDSLSQLLSAAESAARPEIDRIVQAVIDQLRSRSPIGTFDDVAARHMWDEYCWVLQEGPYDDNYMGMGSLSTNWESTVQSFVSSEIETLPKHLLVFLTVYAAENGSDADEYEIGSIDINAIESIIMEKIAEKVSDRNLDLIGPYRAEVIGYEVSREGIVCSALSSADLLSEILASHVDTLIDTDADLSEIALEMVDAYIDLIKTEAESGSALPEFLVRFEDDIKALINNNDILPALENMRGELLESLDA